MHSGNVICASNKVYPQDASKFIHKMLLHPSAYFYATEPEVVNSGKIEAQNQWILRMIFRFLPIFSNFFSKLKRLAIN